MNTIRIYLTESGRIADLQKDFPLYQGQFQNKLLNVFVPTSILAPMFTSSGAVSADYVASTSTKIGMTYTARDGSIKTSKNYYMRYLKTLMYKGVEYALYERKLPKEFTFYAGQGENSPVLIINVVNIEQQSGDTPPLVLSVITSQTCHLDVMQSTFLDRDELNEPSELENLNAQVQALNALMPKKQDKEDESIALEQAPAEKTVVGAINKLGGLVKTAQSSADTAQQTADNAIQEIGDLSALATDEKSTVVKAINEVDQHANNAVATANGAVATANEAKTTAQTAETNANSAVDTANAANATAGEAKAIAQGSQRAIGFATLQAAITALNGYSNTQLKVGDNVYIVETGVPDLWVAAVEQNSVAYNYTTNDAFNDDLVENTLVQVGYYKFAYLESDGKPCTVAWQNMTVAESDWVASTEFADFPYEAKIILSDFVNFSSIPQVVFGLTEATSGNYAPICKAGDKGVYIYGKVNTAITLPTVVTFAPNVHGASMQGGGYTNKGKWVASTTYAIDDLVYTDNGQYVCIEGITSTTSPEQDTQHWQATFVATGKTKNALKIGGQDNGTGVQKTFDGSTAVEVAFDETTMTAKEVDGVLKVGAKGTIPEALPQEASALTSGNLPTSGWTATVLPLWEGDIFTTSYGEDRIILPSGSLDFNKLKQYTNKTDWQIWTEYPYSSNTYQTPSFANAYSSGIEIGDNNKLFIIKPDGSLYARNQDSSSVYFKGLKCLANSQYVYTISDTSITANSDVLMELTDDGGVKSYSMEAGKMTVIRDTVPTQPIPYTYKVKQTNASGQFTLVNHYVPSISESPTSLPVTYKKASGELPTSGWENVDVSWTGNVTSPSNYSYLRKVTTIAGSYATNEIFYKTTYDNLLKSATVASTGNGPIGDYQASDAYSQTGDYKLYKEESNAKIHIVIYDNGNIYYSCQNGSGTGKYALTELSVTSSRKTYTISDTSITANTSVKMYLTDDGGVKAYSKAVGSIQVIRDSVPTTAIPYEYEVEETSAEGLFEVINAYVPTIPTKTSELTNDSGFITASDIPTIPTKTSQLENDSNFAKTNVSNSWGSTQTFTAYDGIKTNRICNAAGTSLVDGTGTTNKFGNVNTPTIIKTSEARPKAEVPYADGTVTRQIALLEDIPSMVIDWVGPSATEQVITGTGMRQIFAEFTDTVGDVSTLYKFYGEVYVDGQNEVNGTSSTVYSTNTEGTELHVITVTPTIRRNTNNEFVLRAECCKYTIGASPMSINKSYLSFVFRKRLY